MEKYFDKLGVANEQQIEYGKLFGLNIDEIPKDVARAMIDEVIGVKFCDEKKKAATISQINLGEKFGLDFTKYSCSVARKYIKNLMFALNLKSIEEQGIKPGDYVINKYDKNKITYKVSSINTIGYVFFKKRSDSSTRNHAGASARHLLKINKELMHNIFERYAELVEL